MLKIVLEVIRTSFDVLVESIFLFGLELLAH